MSFWQKPPTVPTMTRPIGVTVLGVPADQLAQTSVFYLLANHPSEHPAVRRAPSAQFLWHVPRSYRGGVSLHVRAPGFIPIDAPLTPPVQDLPNQLSDVYLVPIHPVVTLEPLRVRGQFFETVSGKRWTQIACSDFNLYLKYLENDGAEAIADERAAIGFNQVRVFGMFKGALGTFLPQARLDYYALLPKFAEMLAQRGLGLEFTVFADATQAMPKLSDQITHWNHVCAALSSTPQTLTELLNEGDQPINRMDANAFSQPAGLLSSHGSNGADSLGVEPIWTYTSLHPARPTDWPRRGGHNAFEIANEVAHKPCTVNESCRPDQGRGPNASDHRDAAANISLMCGGGTFHSIGGKESRLFNADERRCAEAWVRGAKAVPLEFQDGRYAPGHLQDVSPITWEPSNSSRAHGRILGNRACMSCPQMTPGWVPQGKDGWRIVSQDGSVLLLER